jgi:hypothetical protein
MLLGYLLPTAAMYYPFSNVDHTMLASAIWQPSPILVNLLWAFFSSMSSSTKGGQDYIRVTLIASAILSTFSHIATTYICYTSSDLTYGSVFLPIDNGSLSFESAIHYIFQVDFLFVQIATTVWCFQSLVNVNASTPGIRPISPARAACFIVGGAVAVGPAATLSAVWYWREGQREKLESHSKAT